MHAEPAFLLMCSGSEDMVFQTWKSIPSDLSSLHTGKGLWLIGGLYAFFLLTGVELSPAALGSPYTQGMSHLPSSSGLPLVYALLRRPTFFPTMPMSFIKKNSLGRESQRRVVYIGLACGRLSSRPTVGGTIPYVEDPELYESASISLCS